MQWYYCEGRHYENDQFSLSIVYESCCAMCNALEDGHIICQATRHQYSLQPIHAILQSSFLGPSSHLKMKALPIDPLIFLRGFLHVEKYYKNYNCPNIKPELESVLTAKCQGANLSISLLNQFIRPCPLPNSICYLTTPFSFLQLFMCSEFFSFSPCIFFFFFFTLA